MATNFTSSTPGISTDIVCFSHVRFDHIPHHSQKQLSGLKNKSRLFFIEEMVFHDEEDRYDIKQSGKIWIVTPKLQKGEATDMEYTVRQKAQLNRLFAKMEIDKYIFWYFTPLALKISDQFFPQQNIYDYMDMIDMTSAQASWELKLEKMIKQLNQILKEQASVIKERIIRKEVA